MHQLSDERGEPWKLTRSLQWTSIVHNLYGTLYSFTDWPGYEISSALAGKIGVSLGRTFRACPGRVRPHHHENSKKRWRWLQGKCTMSTMKCSKSSQHCFSVVSLWSVLQEALHQVRTMSAQGIHHLPSLASLLKVQQGTATLQWGYKHVGIQSLLVEQYEIKTNS